MTIFALDPGTTETAWVVLSDGMPFSGGIVPNEEILPMIDGYQKARFPIWCEDIASYGMAVGAEVFTTCKWIGRFIERADGNVTCVTRQNVKMHLCRSPRAKDANVRQALIDRLGPQGTKKNPGPTYGIRSHVWSALAVAIYAYDNA